MHTCIGDGSIFKVRGEAQPGLDKPTIPESVGEAHHNVVPLTTWHAHEKFLSVTTNRNWPLKSGEAMPWLPQPTLFLRLWHAFIVMDLITCYTIRRLCISNWLHTVMLRYSSLFNTHTLFRYQVKSEFRHRPGWSSCVWTSKQLHSHLQQQLGSFWFGLHCVWPRSLGQASLGTRS